MPKQVLTFNVPYRHPSCWSLWSSAYLDGQNTRVITLPLYRIAWPPCPVQVDDKALAVTCHFCFSLSLSLGKHVSLHGASCLSTGTDFDLRS